MKYSTFLVIFCVIFRIANSQSRDLTTSNFDSAISKGISMVMFYAPWCGHCQHLKPVWDDLARRVQSNVVIAKVNCDEEPNLASRFNIAGFPSLYVFYEYRKGRKLNDFLTFLDKINTPKKNENGKVQVLTDDNFNEETTIINSPMIVKFYSPGCGYCVQLAPVWDELAEKLRNTNVRVGKINCLENPTICTRYVIQGYPTIKYISEAHFVDYKKERTLDQLEEFVKFSWQKEKQQPKPSFDASHIDWKLIGLVAVVFLVLFCACICLLIWMTNDLSSNDSDVDPFAKKEKPVLKGEKIKVEPNEYLKGKTAKQD